MKKRLLSTLLALALVFGMIGVPVTFADTSVELFAAAPSVIYVSENGVIEGVADENVRTNLTAALTKLGNAPGIIYISGDVDMPIEFGDGTLDAGKITIMGLNGTSDRIMMPLGSVNVKRDLTFDNVSIKPYSIDERWLFANGATIEITENCKVLLSEPYTYAGKTVTTGLYVGIPATIDGDAHYIFADPEATYTMLASMGGYSGRFTANSNVTFDLKAGTYGNIYAGARNGYSSSDYQKLNGDVRFNISGGNFGNLYSANLNGGCIFGNIVFNFTGGTFSAKSNLFLGNANVEGASGSTKFVYADITKLGNTAVIFNSKELKEKDSNISSLTVTTKADYSKIDKKTTAVIFNNAEEDFFPNVNVSGVEYLAKVYYGKAMPVYAESGASVAGDLLGFEFTPDNAGYTPHINGKELSKNAAGYYDIPVSSGSFVEITCENPLLGKKFTASFKDGNNDAAQSFEIEGLSPFTLPLCEAEKSGYYFSGWENEGKVYATGDAFIAGGDVTFNAVWTENSKKSAVYVCANGDDANNGFSPYAPIKSFSNAISKANSNSVAKIVLKSKVSTGTSIKTPAFTVPLVITGEGYNGALYIEAPFSVGGDLTFEHMGLACKQYQFIATNNSHVTFGEGLTGIGNKGVEVHLGKEGSPANNVEATIKSGVFDLIYAGGAYLAKDGIGVNGDVRLNLENVQDFSCVIGFDGYTSTAGSRNANGTIEGNVIIRMKNSHISSIKTTRLTGIKGGFIIISDDSSVYPVPAALPEAESGQYFINTTNDAVIKSAVNESGSSIGGMINVTSANKDLKIRISNDDFSVVYPQGDIPLSPGSYTLETVSGTVVNKIELSASAPMAGHTASEAVFSTESYSACLEWLDGETKIERFASEKAYTARFKVSLYDYVEASKNLAFTINGTACTAKDEGNGDYTVSYTFPKTEKIKEIYVKSTGSDSADGSVNRPVATVNKAVYRLKETGGVIRICDKVDAAGNFVANAKPILITGEGFADAELDVPKSYAIVANGELIFENLTLTMGTTSHLNDNGNKVTIADSVIASGKMFHMGSYYGKTIEKANIFIGGQALFDSAYVGGAYNEKEGCTINKDLSLTLNDTTLSTLYTSPDSYNEKHLGININGNVLITLTGSSSIKNILKRDREITFSEDSVYQFILSDNSSIPAIAEDVIPSEMLYIVKSGVGGKVFHAFDSNGKSVSGAFDIVPNEGHMALIERKGITTLSSGGRYSFPAGETVNVSYVKTDYPLKQYKIHLSGGETYEEILSIDENGCVTFLSTPKRIGYIFEGWYKDAQFTTLVKSGDFIGSYCELYAKYTDASFAYRDEEFAVTGVQIRLPSEEKKQGLRYVIAMDKDVLAEIASFSDKNASIASAITADAGYGAVVLPETYLGGKKLEIDGKYNYMGKTYKAKTVPAKMKYLTTDKKIYFTVCITDIAIEKYEKNYSVRPYITYYTRSGNHATVYADEYSTGVIPTAFEILEKGGETSETRKYLRENLLSVYADNRGIDLIPGEKVDAINAKTETYKKNAVESKNLDLSGLGGKKYYVSNRGNDSNDGLSPEKAWATITKVNAANLKSGDAVLFERGGEFRGKISTKEGVTYSAYGTGDKPIINGSARDYADASLWSATGTENVYKLNEKLSQDVGLIAFDHGREYGDYDALFSTKRVSGVVYGGKKFVDQYDLERDLEFFHDPTDNTLYLYSVKGNPGERFAAIEIATRGNLIDVRVKDVTIDNLHVRYGGSHGVGGGSSRASFDANGNYLGMTACANLKVTNCVFAWIGGSILSETTRYGNAVEIFGSVDGYIVENNWIYQIYDTGITHQLSASACQDSMMQDIYYHKNLVEYCHWSIEFYNQPCCNKHRRVVRNVLAEENILRLGGYGWGSILRKSGATLYNSFGLSKNVEETKNFHAKNNIFFRSTGPIYRLNTNASERNLTFEGNVYVQDYAAPFSWYCGTTYDFKNVNEYIGEGLQVNDPGCEAYFYAP